MTTHRTPRAWDTAWEGTPSWETGRPQAAVVRLLEDVGFGAHQAVLDVGCGSGRHAVLLAAACHRVTGVDVAAAALDRARANARDAGVDEHTTFIQADALELDARLPGAPFDVALDVGLFHALQPGDRQRYAAGLATVIRPGGRAFVLAWSDRNPFGIGPGRVRRRDLRAAFSARNGWRVEGIAEAHLETNLPMAEAHAWAARLARR